MSFSIYQQREPATLSHQTCESGHDGALLSAIFEPDFETALYWSYKPVDSQKWNVTVGCGLKTTVNVEVNVMENIIEKLVFEGDIRTQFPYPMFKERELIRDMIDEYGVAPSSVHVWEHEEKLIVINGFTIVEICRIKRIPITERNIVRMKFQDITEVLFWRARHKMAGQHLTTFQKVRTALKHKPVFAEIGRRRMSEGGQGSCSEHEPWDTMRELEKTFHIVYLQQEWEF